MPQAEGNNRQVLLSTFCTAFKTRNQLGVKGVACAWRRARGGLYVPSTMTTDILHIFPQSLGKAMHISMFERGHCQNSGTTPRSRIEKEAHDACGVTSSASLGTKSAEGFERPPALL
jgi:hypothetical protein